MRIIKLRAKDYSLALSLLDYLYCISLVIICILVSIL